jgi:protein TonB
VVASKSADPLDLTSAMVTGDAATFAGGTTTSSGTNDQAVHGPVSADGGAGPARPPPPPPGPDRSHAVSLDASEWSCPWPREADAEQIDAQSVVLKVLVRPDGSVHDARITQDPGFGFGTAALACARRTRFEAARDRSGTRVLAWSPAIRVRFVR